MWFSQYFDFFAPSDSRFSNSCISAKYCQMLTSIHQWKAYLFSFQGPGSDLLICPTHENVLKMHSCIHWFIFIAYQVQFGWNFWRELTFLQHFYKQKKRRSTSNLVGWVWLIGNTRFCKPILHYFLHLSWHFKVKYSVNDTKSSFFLTTFYYIACCVYCGNSEIKKSGKWN